MADSIRLTRQDLYDRVWSTPAWKLGPELGLSGRGLAKRCARGGIPVPQRGYWAKLQVGKAPKRTPLMDPWPPVTAPKPDAPRINDTGTHVLITSSRDLFAIGRRTENGYLKPHKRLIVDVFTSEAALAAALGLANALFVRLETRKHHVTIAPAYMHRPEVDEREKDRRNRWSTPWAPQRPTVTTVGNVTFGLTIYELSEDVEVRYLDGEYIRVTALTPTHLRRMGRVHTWTTHQDYPSGRLCVRAYSPNWVEWQREWRETKPGQLVGRVTVIVSELERSAPALAELIATARREAELQHQRWEAERIVEERRETERLRVKAIQDSKDDLLAAIKHWGTAKNIEGFFEDAEQRAGRLSDEERATILDRLTRARQLIGAPDALQRLREWKAPEDR